MAQVTLPTLAWNMTPIHQISGSGAPTSQQMLEAVESAFSSATYWEVYTTTTLTGSSYFLEVGPKSDSAIYDKYRILFCGAKPSGSSGNGPIRSILESTSQQTSYEGLWVSFLAGSGSLKHPCPIGSGFDDAYGPNLRWSGWWHMNYDSTKSKGEQVWLIESDEVVNVFIENTQKNNRNWGSFGALIYPFSDSVAESDGRIYGMFTTNPGGAVTNINGAGGNTTVGWYTNSSSGNAIHFGGFRPSINGNSGSFDIWYASDGHALMSNTYNRISVTPSGDMAYEPHFIYRTQNTPHYPLGQARQVYAINRMDNRIEVIDSGGNTAGFTFNPSTAAGYTGDTVFFGNA